MLSHKKKIIKRVVLIGTLVLVLILGGGAMFGYTVLRGGLPETEEIMECAVGLSSTVI